MLFYASLLSIVVVITAYPVFLAVLAHEGMDYKLAYFVITAYILAIALAFLLSGFFCFHLWLLSN
jgi:palmitoyltransferase ZDHHC2/15/20